MAINEKRGMHVNLVVSGLAKDAADFLKTVTDAPLEDIVSTALINEAALRLYELEGENIYIGKKRRRKKLTRVTRAELNIPETNNPKKSNVIFLSKRGKRTP